MTRHRAVFLPHDKSGWFDEGTTVLDAALECGILIRSVCAGIGTCARCKVEVKSGASEVTRLEKDLLSATELKKGVRLACQAAIEGDVICRIPERSLSDGDQILVTGSSDAFALDPDLVRLSIETRTPQLGERTATIEEFRNSLEDAGRPATHVPLDVMREVSRRTESVHSVVVDRTRLLTVEAQDARDLYAIALDIGTTTVAAKLIDLSTDAVLAVESTANPQAAFGADVVSRLNHVRTERAGLRKLHKTIIHCVNEIVASLCESASVGRDRVFKIVAVGNPVMNHLLLGVDPSTLAEKPYVPAFLRPVAVTASHIGVRIHPHGVVYSAPNLAGYVGSDITAVLVALGLEKPDELVLALDFGTNGEIVLSSPDRLLCCSSPAGPAWEGACITWGMRASRGAIERAEIQDGVLQFRTIGDVPPIGICGSGLIDLVCEMGRAGVIAPSGRIVKPAGDISSSLAERIHADTPAHIDIAPIDQERILLTQDDVREVQLAKAGIAAGIRILMDEMGVTAADVAHVYIAGAFGNHIRNTDVVDLNLIAGVNEERFEFVGNAALSGAEAILRSRQARATAERLSERMDYIEIAGHPAFQDYFVEYIPFGWT